MYSLARELGFKDMLVHEGPYLVIALLAAETFFKWGSFLLELAGFLALWTVLSFAGNQIMMKWRGQNSQ